MTGAVVESLAAVSAAVVVVQARLAQVAARARPACPADDEPPLPWPARTLATARTIAAECLATAWLVASAPLAAAPERPLRRGARRPVVLVHGWAQHRGMLAILARRLRRDGWPVRMVRYRTVGRTVERAAEELQAALARLAAEAEERAVDVVAYGAGGIVVRAAVRRGAPVRRVVTLGTAHQGTLALPAWDAMLADLAAGSPLLRRLAADDPVPATTDFVAIHSADDALIVPPTCGYYPGAFNVELAGTGHGALVLSRRVYELVRENLAADEAAAADAG